MDEQELEQPPRPSPWCHRAYCHDRTAHHTSSRRLPSALCPQESGAELHVVLCGPNVVCSGGAAGVGALQPRRVMQVLSEEFGGHGGGNKKMAQGQLAHPAAPQAVAAALRRHMFGN